MNKPRTSKQYREQGMTEAWLRIDKRIYDSVAWNALSPNAKDIWLRVRTMLDAGRSNNGVLAPTWSECQRRGWMVSNERRIEGLKELLAAGFLAYTRYSGPNTYHRASLYRFTDIPCHRSDKYYVSGCGPTDDFLNWQPPINCRSKRQPPRRTKKNVSTGRPSYEPYGRPSYERDGPTVDGDRKPNGPTVDAIRENGDVSARRIEAFRNSSDSLAVNGQAVISKGLAIPSRPEVAGSDKVCELDQFTRARLRYERTAAKRAARAARRMALGS
jgi:hypothetical protein